MLNFYPRSPCGERHLNCSRKGLAMRYFYPRSPCGERRRRSVKLFRQNYISIHALLAESDLTIMLYDSSALIFLSTLSLRRATGFCYLDKIEITISIHALLAESDPGKVKVVEPGFVFLSTLSLRRATANRSTAIPNFRYFYPRSPCGERPITITITCTALRFLSTLSLRRATHYDNYNLHCVEISIHALLAESDGTSSRK